MIGSIGVKANGQGIPFVSLVDLSNLFCDFCSVAQPVVLDVYRNSLSQKLYTFFIKVKCTCCIDFLLHICSLNIEVCGVSTFYSTITLYTLEVGCSSLIPFLREFVVGGCLLKDLDGLFSPFTLLVEEVPKSRACINSY